MPNPKREQKHKTHRLAISLLVISAFSVILTLAPPSTRSVLAQTLSLSISPPLVELTIQPDRQVTLSYQLTNNSEQDQVITPNLKRFVPHGLNGLVQFENVPKDNPILLSFESGERFNQPFSLPIGQTKQLVLKVSPTLNAPEKDYYFTLLFSTNDNNEHTGNQTGSITQIGTNLIITVSMDGQPKVTGQIDRFSIPKIIDSFDAVKIDLSLKNSGNVLFKPFGQITFTGWFSQKKEISLLEQNVLASSTRHFEIETYHPNFPIGKFTAIVSFRPNQQLPEINQTYNFYYLPIKLSLIGFLFFVLIKLVRRLKQPNPS